MKDKLLFVLLILLMMISCSKSEGYKKKLKVPYQKMEPEKLTIVDFNNAFFSIDTANFDEDYQDSLSVAFSRAQIDSIEITQPATSSDTHEHNQSRNAAEEQHHQ